MAIDDSGAIERDLDDWVGLASPGAPVNPRRIFHHQYQYLGGFLILGIAISLSKNTEKFSGLDSVILAQD